MANWAIVVGVDKYWRAEACLRGAVWDALHMRTWLLDPAGGAVPPQNLTLLLAPHRTAPPPDVAWTEATHGHLVEAMERLFQRSDSVGERVFFSFSGHGLSARINFSNQSAIALTDFTDSAALRDAIERVGFQREPSGAVSPSEAVGPSAWLELSTVLALAAAASLELDSPYGMRLKQLGVPSFQQLAPQATSGIQVVVGDDSGEAPDWNRVIACCRPQTAGGLPGLVQATPAANLPSAASVALSTPPGSFFLGLRFGSSQVGLPVAVLPGRVTLVIAVRRAHGAFALHLYMPALPSAATEDYSFRDPMFSGSRFPAIRRIELMQRSVISGRITPTAPDVEMLLHGKWADPIAGCLGGYLLIRRGESKELKVPARNLTKYFDGIPDAYVLLGEFLEHADQATADATTAYMCALDRGLPMFRDGLVLLDAAIRRRSIQHDCAAAVARMLARVPAGALWNSQLESTTAVLEPEPRDDPEAFGAASAMATS